MTLIKLLIASLLVSQIFGLGADVTCADENCTNSGVCTQVPSVPSGLSWIEGGSSGKCAINKCPEEGTASGLTGASDLFCQSCPGTPNGQVQAVFANTAKTGCVPSRATCGNTRAANSWTNDDCLACNGNSNQYASTDKSSCQATPPPGADVTCADENCTNSGVCTQVPSVPSGLSWIEGGSSGKCAINKCPEEGTASGLTGASDLFCQSCPGTPNGQVQAVFANTAKTGCVASRATCGNTRAANSWTNEDCLACNGNSNQYASTDQSSCQATAPETRGADVTCADENCTNSGSCTDAPSFPSGLSWIEGGSSGKCAINKCPVEGTASGLTGASDLFCQSCPGTPNGQVQAVFANTAKTGCVASRATCGNTRAANSWTNDDCLACNGNSNQYASTDKSSCQATPPPGADVTCADENCTNSGVCTQVPSVPSGLSWIEGGSSGKCAINQCPIEGTASGLTGASDLFCQSCPGTPNGQVQAVFANTAKTGCVASRATCGNTRAANSWTNEDCLACNGNSNQYASTDQSSCQETAPSTPGADVTCADENCTNSGSCTDAPSVPSGLSWIKSASQGKCAINKCPVEGTASGLTGASDLFCQSCPGTPNGQVQAVFANAAKTGCVASSATCGNTRAANSWTNDDCLACNGDSNQYASTDKSSCQSTAASSSSTTNSIIILSSILFLISFLF
ncbi:hypothetical protein ABPG74_006672 [Tetrahymena malaccensis]